MPHRRPIGLSSYLALTRTGSGPATGYPALAKGRPVVWLHGDSAAACRALTGLGSRLLQIRDDIQIIMTGTRFDFTSARAWDMPVIPANTPDEAFAEIDAFLDWSRPSVLVWSGNALRPALLTRTHETGCRMIGLNMHNAPFGRPGRRWLPDFAPAVLDQFSDLFAVDEAAMRALRRMNLPNEKLHETGPLRDTVVPPPVRESTRNDIAQSLTGRPTWLAAYVTRGEIGDVLSAHLGAARYSHRSLLILSLASHEDAAYLVDKLQHTGLRACSWDDGDEIEDATQVVYTSDPAALGLWYSLAPITFLGGSLVAGHGGHDPYPAVSLGSALLYGPNVGKHLTAYSALADAGAARIVRDASSLADALRAIMAAHVAARMALAGWRVVTDGATLTDTLADMITETIDAEETTG